MCNSHQVPSYPQICPPSTVPSLAGTYHFPQFSGPKTLAFLSLSPPLLFGLEVIKVYTLYSHHLHGTFVFLWKMAAFPHFIIPQITKGHKMGVYNHNSINYTRFFSLTASRVLNVHFIECTPKFLGLLAFIWLELS